MAGGENFLSRWSRRKVEARSAPAEPAPLTATPAGEAQALPAKPVAPSPAERPPLPAVESLTPESDYAPFMAPDVDGGVRRQALKTLFSDPRYNVMDMMDVYVDDYSRPDPIPESWMGKLEQLSRLGDRAGRDREEAERRRALAQEVAEAKAEAEAEAEGPAAVSAGDPPGSLREEPEAPAEASAAANALGSGTPSDAPIPPSKVRESGT